jgi:hypothetical protein
MGIVWLGVWAKFGLVPGPSLTRGLGLVWPGAWAKIGPGRGRGLARGLGLASAWAGLAWPGLPWPGYELACRGPGLNLTVPGLACLASDWLAWHALA